MVEEQYAGTGILKMVTIEEGLLNALMLDECNSQIQKRANVDSKESPDICEL